MKLGFIAQNDLEGIEADCRFAAEHGFSGLEFNYWGGFKDLTAETVAQMRATLDRYGLECSTFGLWGLEPYCERPGRAHRKPQTTYASDRFCPNHAGADFDYWWRSP